MLTSRETERRVGERKTHGISGRVFFCGEEGEGSSLRLKVPRRHSFISLVKIILSREGVTIDGVLN
jgi:hypothetical protein